jgi:hypothetical protein
MCASHGSRKLAFLVGCLRSAFAGQDNSPDYRASLALTRHYRSVGILPVVVKLCLSQRGSIIAERLRVLL